MCPFVCLFINRITGWIVLKSFHKKDIYVNLILCRFQLDPHHHLNSKMMQGLYCAIDLQFVAFQSVKMYNITQISTRKVLMFMITNIVQYLALSHTININGMRVVSPCKVLCVDIFTKSEKGHVSQGPGTVMPQCMYCFLTQSGYPVSKWALFNFVVFHSKVVALLFSGIYVLSEVLYC